jgi:hypothetical protein
MHEFANMSAARRNIGEQHAAASVGATQEVRMGWAKLRQAQQAGMFVPTIAQRSAAAQEAMKYDARAGGWTGGRKWSGPGVPSYTAGVGNRNVAAQPASSNPFDGRQSFFDVAQEARRQQLKQYFSAQFAGRPTAGPMP